MKTKQKLYIYWCFNMILNYSSFMQFSLGNLIQIRLIVRFWNLDGMIFFLNYIANCEKLKTNQTNNECIKHIYKKKKMLKFFWFGWTIDWNKYWNCMQISYDTNDSSTLPVFFSTLFLFMNEIFFLFKWWIKIQ